MSSPDSDDITQKIIKIMIVEDVEFNLNILTDILSGQGWRIVPAASGEAALKILAQDADFQIILMDIGLPGIDGVEATRRIKENPMTRAIPVIALTAETDAERERFLAAGMDGYAEKNFDPGQLFATIEKHLLLSSPPPRETGPNPANQTEDCDIDFEALFATYADENTLCRIAEAFFVDADKQMLQLDKAMTMGDQAGILACCHGLSGSATIFTAKNLATAVKELDECIRHSNKNDAESAWRNVCSAHDRLHEAVANRLNLPRQSP